MPRYIALFRSFWMIDPFKVAITVFFIGLIPFMLAVLRSDLGWVAYSMSRTANEICTTATANSNTCFAKQVGYMYALNWWPVMSLFFPAALFFAFSSIRRTKQVVEQMMQEHMFARKDWKPATESDLAPIISGLWKSFFFWSIPILLVVVGTMFMDWRNVVYCPLRVGAPLGSVQSDQIPPELQRLMNEFGCQTGTDQENDWSVSAVFGGFGFSPLANDTHAPGVGFNQFFSAYNYFFVAIWTTLLLAYFIGFVLSLCRAISRLADENSDVRLVLDLKSADARHRRGFELLEPILAPCVYVVMLAFVMACLMRLQNEFLRDREFETIVGFWFNGVPDILPEILKGETEALAKFLDLGQFSNPNVFLGAPLLIILASLSGVMLSYLLGNAAQAAQRTVETALDNSPGKEAVSRYYGLPLEEVEERTRTLETWPLSWPALRTGLRLLGIGFICFFFYKASAVWIAYLAVTKFRSFLNVNTNDPPTQDDQVLQKPRARGVRRTTARR